MKILACIMFKNEEEVLLRCIDSIKDLVDGYYLVDTKSTDSTVEKVNEYFEKRPEIPVYQSQLEFENFVDTKNKVLELANNLSDTYDYVMWMDADEYFTEEDSAKLKNIIHADVHNSMIVTYIQDYHGNVKSSIYERPRIWKNGQFFFNGPGVHEYITNSPDALILKDVYVYHSHKTINKTYNTDLYIKLMTDHLEQKNSKDTRALFYLTRTYFDRFFQDTSNESNYVAFKYYNNLYRFVIEENPDNIFLEEYWYSYYQEGLIQRTRGLFLLAETLFKKCIALIPRRLEAYTALAHTYKMNHNEKDAILLLEKILFVNEQFNYILFVEPLENIKICHLLFTLYWDNYKFQKSINLLLHIIEHPDYNAYNPDGSIKDSFNWFNNNTFKVYKYDINTFFDKIYYINLDRRNDRNETIKRGLIESGIYNIERVAGIDGNLFLDEFIVNRNIPVKRTVGYYGCFLSHLNVIKRAYNDNLNNVLILEDDVAIHSNLDFEFNKIMNYINHKQMQWDILYLGHVNYNGVYNISEEESKNWTINKIKNNSAIYSKNVWGCHAYALNRNAMKEIIDYYESNGHFYELDRVLAGALKDKLKYITVYPQLFVQRDTKSDTTNIDSIDNDHFVYAVNSNHSSRLNYII